LTSKIINMVEKLKDAEDRLLESMFQSESIADDGFSKRIVTKIRLRMWLRRLTLPIAMFVGGSIAIKPIAQLSVAVSKLLTVIPLDLLEAPVAWIPQPQYVVLGAMLLVAAMLGVRLLED
jgi:hypothetical protein